MKRRTAVPFRRQPLAVAAQSGARAEETERLSVDGLDQRLEALTGQVNEMTPAIEAWRRGELAARTHLRDAREHLLVRTAEAAAIMARLNTLAYEQLIPRFRAGIVAVVPRGAVVLVVSRGDARLLELQGRSGWHFLQATNGVYAGHHPADSTSAIKELEELRAQGARFLAFPKTAFWWLDHYAAFARYLDERFRVVARDEWTSVIYALNKPWPRS